MSSLGAQVSELEDRLDELITQNAELISENTVQVDTIDDLTASLTGATREIEELYEQLQYYEQLHPELKTSWKVKIKLEDR